MPITPLPPITIDDLTQVEVTGSGVFDVLMRATKGHLEQEFKLGRIKGAEYSTVYLGSLEAVLQTALQFLLEKDKQALEAQLLEQQILLAQVEVQKAQAELAIIQASLPKVEAEIDLLEAQAAVQRQTVIKLQDDLLTSTIQRNLLSQQVVNAGIEATVLQGQKCKLDAEFDLLQEQKLKAAQETLLLAQKVLTEKAQTQATGTDPESVLGKQKALYQAQATGFTRDAEQKAASIMVDSWRIRRTTDTGTIADSTNMLSDAAIGRAVNKLLSGVGA